MNLIGILGVAVTASVIIGMVRQLRPELALYVSAAAAMLMVYYSLEYFRPMLTFLYDLGGSGTLGGYVKIIMKLTAIGALTSVVSGICADMGENGIAAKAELVGKGAAAFAVLPVLRELISSLGDLLM